MSRNAGVVVRTMREDRGRFASLRDCRVLVYWPHGFGDWVHFGTIAPLLEPSNTYAITRFGDDYVALMDGSPAAASLYSGVRVPGDGGTLGAPHLGLRLKKCDGRSATLHLPSPLREAVVRFAPEVVLWTDYPETEGLTAFPYHTKARNLARLLVAPARLDSLDLARPLTNVIDFNAPPAVRQLVQERLTPFAPPGTRLCVISRSGVTAARKNWGDGSQARAFVRAIGARPGWRFLSMDDELLAEGAATFRALFAGIDLPFAHLFKAAAARMDLFVGIPAGPLHFVLARGGIPVVGVWTAHHPDWYDEPNADAIHLVGRYVRDRGFDRRPATLTKPASLRHRLRYLDEAVVEAEEVLAAAETVLR